MKPWIGLIRLVNGQRQQGGHPCCAWLTPPLHPARGREGDSFAMVLELSGPASSRLYREIRDAAAQAFWSTPGSPVAALRRAIIAANRTLSQFNHQVPVESRCWGNLACAALCSNEVFIAIVGIAQARLLSAGVQEQYPDQFLPPLGSRQWAEVSIAYSPIQPGTTLLLTPQTLTEFIAPDALDVVLRRKKEEILDGLEQLAGGESLTALVICWPEEQPAPLPPPPRRRRILPPKEVSTTPPLEELPREPQPIPQEIPPWAPAIQEEVVGGKEAETEAELPKPVPWEQRDSSVIPGLQPRAAEPRRPAGGILAVGRALINGASIVGQAVARAAVSMGRGMGTFIRRGGSTLFRRTLPGTERPPRVQRAVRLPPPENSRQMAAIAIIILILVVLITLLTWFQYGRNLRRNQALSLAQKHVAAAQQAPQPDLARSHWEAVLTLLADYDDPEATALRTMAQDVLDVMDGVIRVDPILVADLKQTSLSRLATWEQSIAVVENGAQVRHILVGGESELIPLSQVSAVVDIARYQPKLRASPVLLILGADGSLWGYDAHWSQAHQYAFSPPPGGHMPVAMETYQERLYLLDPTSDQIWRYWAQGEEFTAEAERYFSEPLSLDGARDMAIDGNIYVLFEDGRVARYLEGRAVPFAVTGVPSPAARFTALAVDPQLTNGPVYLADGASERIVILKETGAFCAQLRAQGEEFRDLQALTISDTGNDLFISAGGKIYRVPIPPLPCR